MQSGLSTHCFNPDGKATLISELLQIKSTFELVTHERFAKDSIEDPCGEFGIRGAPESPRHQDYLEPSCVEEELEEGEDWNVQIQVMPRVTFGGIQELPSNQACEEECVDGESDNLEQRETRVRGQRWLPTGTMVQSGQVEGVRNTCTGLGQSFSQ